jgi:hypothetical protein
VATIELIIGLVLAAGGTAVFHAINPDGEKPRRWTKIPGMEMLVVFAVLGGWAIGASLVIDAAIRMLS